MSTHLLQMMTMTGGGVAGPPDPPLFDTLDFPRVSFDMIGNFDAYLVAAPGPALRTNLGLADYVNLRMSADGPWDNGDNSYLSRQEMYDDLITSNPNIYISEYTDVIEHRLNGTHASKVFTETGPTGAATYWDAENDEEPYNSTGDPVNDWWLRNKDGDKYIVFTTGAGDSFGINITDYTTVDGNGDRYPQYFGKYILAESLYITTPKDGNPGSVGIYSDVMRYNYKASNIDWDGDGVNEDAEDDWDDGGPGEEAATKWREGHEAYLDVFRDEHTGINTGGNISEHARGNNATDMSFLPYVYDEYYQKIQIGHVQNSSLPTNHPRSRVFSDGTQNPLNTGSWQQAYNAYVQAMLSTAEPHLCTMDWRVDLDDGYNPTSSGSVLNLARWGFATVLMDNGFFALNKGNQNYRRTPLMDETGLINTGTTGLSKGWLGQPIDAVQRTPQQSTNIWWREFDNGLVILNTDNDDAGSATSVTVSGLPGGATEWKRITGSQDSTWNDGSNVTADFDLAQIDAIILERR